MHINRSEKSRKVWEKARAIGAVVASSSPSSVMPAMAASERIVVEGTRVISTSISLRVIVELLLGLFLFPQLFSLALLYLLFEILSHLLYLLAIGS